MSATLEPTEDDIEDALFELTDRYGLDFDIDTMRKVIKRTLKTQTRRPAWHRNHRWIALAKADLIALDRLESSR